MISSFIETTYLLVRSYMGGGADIHTDTHTHVWYRILPIESFDSRILQYMNEDTTVKLFINLIL